MKNLIMKYKHAWILSYFFIYLPWFVWLERHITKNYTLVTLDFDKYIPFNEFFVIPYMLWFVYIAITITYLFFTNKTDYYKCCGFLFLGMTICLLIYTIWPNGQNLRPTTFTRDNLLIDAVKKIYSTDTATNVCPSIHVFNSIGAHIAIARNERLKRHRVLVTGSFLLAILISLSTVFLKQHSIFDGICSIFLSVFCYFIVYKIDYTKLVAYVKQKKELGANYRL